MKETWYKISIVLLTILINASSIIDASNYTKCVILNDQQCMIQPTLINLHPNEYT